MTIGRCALGGRPRICVTKRLPLRRGPAAAARLLLRARRQLVLQPLQQVQQLSPLLIPPLPAAGSAGLPAIALPPLPCSARAAGVACQVGILVVVGGRRRGGRRSLRCAGGADLGGAAH